MSLSKRLAGIVVLGALGAVVIAAPASAKTRVVKPGESIQKAIDKSKRGDTVSLRKGSYRESLQINRSIILEGHGSTLLPPKTPAKTLCNQMGPQTGICAVGKVKIGNGPPKVVAKVANIKVERLTVKGFPGDGLFGFGTRKLRLLHARFIGNHGYGVFSNTSIGTRIIGSLAKDNHEPGFYIGDSLPAHAIVRGSTAIGNSFGLFLRDAIGGMITHNTFSGNCAGVVALGDAPGPSSGWKILNNHADHNNRRCGPGEEGGVSGVGIGLSGVRRSTVANNTVRRNLPKHKSDLHGGILIVKGEGGTAPRKLRIVGNTVLHNRPADIFWDKSGSVHFAQNHCRRSKPKHICS